MEPVKRSSAPSGSRKSAGQPPRKKKRKRSVAGALGGTLSYILLVLGVSLILATVAILVANDMFALVKDDTTVMLEFDEDLAPGEMARVLQENGLIKYRWIFTLFANLKDIENFSSGTFQLSASMDYGQMISTLQRESTYQETVDVTIPEGYTIAQIAELMEKARVCGSDDFIETANTYDFAHEMLEDVPMVENRLEGYLFPDTYEFYVNDRPVSVINKMLNNFVDKYTDEMIALTEEKGMTIAEVVNIASLIERECRIPDEQTMISGVIHNRLDNSDEYPYLDIDATLLYAIGHKEELTAEDLETDTPYNTRLYPGLPPTAICNPGISAMLAALQPAEHNYYYYVANPQTGAHVFSRTLEEHNRAVAEMRALDEE